MIIHRFAGPNPGRIKYLDVDEVGVSEYATNSPTVYGHSAAPGGFAVAAVPYFDQDTPESFTSEGPTTILFDPPVTRWEVQKFTVRRFPY
ncbi:MAG: hypothetical protein R3B91_11020 [Planctomycetaceae bacterium]